MGLLTSGKRNATPPRGLTIAGETSLVISIARTPDELSALISRCASVAAPDGAIFEVISAPLDQVKRSVYPPKDRLQESWRYLREVKAVDRQTLFHIFVVLLETVPGAARERAAALPAEWSMPTVAVRPTEAHPRAFKGTKVQPPKPRRLPPTDIRPHLCDPRAVRALMSPLWKFLPAVRSELVAVGYTAAALDAVENELRPAAPGKSRWSLPTQFVQYIWPSVRQGRPRDLSTHLSLFAELELECDRRTLAAFSRLVKLAGAAIACSWGRIAVRLPADRRAVFVEKLIETEACRSLPEPEIEGCTVETSLLATGEQFPPWVERLLLAAPNSLSSGYLLAGFRLAAHLAPGHQFQAIGQCANFPETDVEEIAIAIQLVDSGWLALTLWDRCGRLPGFSELINRSRWRAFDPKAAHSYFRFLIGIVYCDLRDSRLQRKWRAIAEEIPRIEALILATSAPYQAKLVDCISEWLSFWDDPATIRKRLPDGYRLLRRLTAPPFRTGEDASRALLYFLELEGKADLARFLTAPDASFESLEKSCRRDNDATLIARGLEQLTQLLGPFTIDAFLAAPGKLCRTAKVLGSVSAPVRLQIGRQCLAHPFFQADLLGTPIRELCGQIAAHRTAKQTNPIPARLGSWLRDEINLSPARLERYRRVLAENFVLTRLGLIEESVVDWLKRGLPAGPVTKAGEHALRLLGDVRENRRGLRKALNAHWAGNHEYLAKHPATLAWYRRHKTVPRELWEQGIPFESGEFSIRVERDPFEILKLGTYVGSCLGIGGICSDSAVAALLDANKRVLYARDHRGRVIARQLIAISDDDRLVCFEVYPLAAGQPIKALFRNYDYAFAAALNLPVYERGEADEGYVVSSVLSVNWWDDLSWDFKLNLGAAKQ